MYVAVSGGRLPRARSIPATIDWTRVSTAPTAATARVTRPGGLSRTATITPQSDAVRATVTTAATSPECTGEPCHAAGPRAAPARIHGRRQGPGHSPLGPGPAILVTMSESSTGPAVARRFRVESPDAFASSASVSGTATRSTRYRCPTESPPLPKYCAPRQAHAPCGVRQPNTYWTYTAGSPLSRLRMLRINV